MARRRTRAAAVSGALAAMTAGALVVGIGVVGTGVTGALAVPAAGGEFTVSGVGTNNQIAPGPDGNMWVTLDSGGKDVARISPAGVVDEFDVSNVSSPTGITAGPDGNLWVIQSGGVARFSPADPMTGTATPIADIADPRAMTVGPDGNLWTASGDKVIRIPPAAPATFQSFGATGVQGARWIAAGTDGVWVADFGGSQVVHVTTAGVGTAYPTGAGGGPQGVAFGGGLAGYADPGTTPQTVGRIASGGSPAPTSVPNTDPFGMTYGADGAFWFAQFLTDSVGRLAADGTVTTLALPPGSGPRQLSGGPGDTLWVTLDTAEKVARITGVTAAPTPTSDQAATTTAAPSTATATSTATSTPTASPTPTPTTTRPVPPGTTIAKAPRKVVRTTKARATVVFRFTSNTAGATFRCRLGSAPFRSCASPKAYRLKPGRYTFKVRAVAGGVLDPTPAVRTFRVVRR